MTTDPTYGSDPRSYPPPFPAGLVPGGLVVRFFARLIDGIIVGVVCFLLSFFTDTLSSIWVTGLFTGLLMFVYFVAFETAQGWTLGKRVLGLRVHGPGGAPKPTAQQSAIRNVWTLFPIILSLTLRVTCRRRGSSRGRPQTWRRPMGWRT